MTLPLSFNRWSIIALGNWGSNGTQLRAAWTVVGGIPGAAQASAAAAAAFPQGVAADVEVDGDEGAGLTTMVVALGCLVFGFLGAGYVEAMAWNVAVMVACTIMCGGALLLLNTSNAAKETKVVKAAAAAATAATRQATSAVSQQRAG